MTTKENRMKQVIKKWMIDKNIVCDGDVDDMAEMVVMQINRQRIIKKLTKNICLN